MHVAKNYFEIFKNKPTIYDLRLSFNLKFILMAKFKNVPDTSGEKCNCSDWIAHFEKFSNIKVEYCAEKKCIKKIGTHDIVGAHVVKVNSIDKNHYILPLCKDHNHHTNTDEME